MSKMQNMSDEQIRKAIETFNQKLPLIPDGEDRDLCLVGLENFQNELARRNQKKSESQPVEKIEQLPDREQQIERENKAAWFQEKREQAKEEKQKFEVIMEKSNLIQPESNPIENEVFRKSFDNLKTVKAPAFMTPDELINVELEDSKGNKQIKTFSKAQVRALARKYFSNVHESWLGKDRKMGVGFKNLLAYVVAWKEFDGEIPQPSQILPYYDRYKQGEKASDAFKVAQELYDKIVEILQA